LDLLFPGGIGRKHVFWLASSSACLAIALSIWVARLRLNGGIHPDPFLHWVVFCIALGITILLSSLITLRIIEQIVRQTATEQAVPQDRVSLAVPWVMFFHGILSVGVFVSSTTRQWATILVISVIVLSVATVHVAKGYRRTFLRALLIFGIVLLLVVLLGGRK